MIYKLFTGRYIDLSKLVSVSEIVELNNELYLPPNKQFTLTLQLLERPIIIKMIGTSIVSEVSPGSWATNDKCKNETLIEQERDKLLNDWQAFKNNLN